ncbi:hypothetical protein BDV06DRAFT_192133 [Aspergillus oleicola]
MVPLQFEFQRPTGRALSFGVPIVVSAIVFRFSGLGIRSFVLTPERVLVEVLFSVMPLMHIDLFSILQAVFRCHRYPSGPQCSCFLQDPRPESGFWSLSLGTV